MARIPERFVWFAAAAVLCAAVGLGCAERELDPEDQRSLALELAQDLVDGLSPNVDPKMGPGYGIEVRWPQADVTGSIDGTNVWVTLHLPSRTVRQKQRLVEVPGRTFVSDDAGASWIQAAPQQARPAPRALADHPSVQLEPDRGALPLSYGAATALMTAAGSSIQIAIGLDYVARSVDSGGSWETVLDGGPLPVTLVAAPDFADSGGALIAMWRGGVWRTVDFGATWSQVLEAQGDAAHVAFTGRATAVVSEPSSVRWEAF